MICFYIYIYILRLKKPSGTFASPMRSSPATNMCPKNKILGNHQSMVVCSFKTVLDFDGFTKHLKAMNTQNWVSGDFTINLMEFAMFTQEQTPSRSRDLCFCQGSPKMITMITYIHM